MRSFAFVRKRPPCKLKPLAGQPRHPLLARLEKEGLLANVDHFLGVNKPRSLDAKATADGFSYEQMVQPIWDRHCVGCHQGVEKELEEMIAAIGYQKKPAPWKRRLR